MYRSSFGCLHRSWFEILGVLDGADSNVGLFAGIVTAEARDPDFSIADHRSLGVDEEVLVFLLEDGVCDVVGDDAVVILDELLFVFDGEGFFARVDLDGVVNEGGDGGGIVFGDGRLELDKETSNFGVVADRKVDGLVESGGGGLCGAEAGGKERACDQGETCELSADGHSISVENVKDLSRAIGYTCLKHDE